MSFIAAVESRHVHYLFSILDKMQRVNNSY